MICGDFATHTPTHPVESGITNWNFWISSIVQLFDFLTIDVLCITVNFGHSFDTWLLLKPPQPARVILVTIPWVGLPSPSYRIPFDRQKCTIFPVTPWIYRSSEWSFGQRKKNKQTRMHSSRMPTVLRSDRLFCHTCPPPTPTTHAPPAMHAFPATCPHAPPRCACLPPCTPPCPTHAPPATHTPPATHGPPHVNRISDRCKNSHVFNIFLCALVIHVRGREVLNRE